jgi:hypothetical protein
VGSSPTGRRSRASPRAGSGRMVPARGGESRRGRPRGWFPGDRWPASEPARDRRDRRHPRSERMAPATRAASSPCMYGSPGGSSGIPPARPPWRSEMIAPRSPPGLSESASATMSMNAPSSVRVTLADPAVAATARAIAGAASRRACHWSALNASRSLTWAIITRAQVGRSQFNARPGDQVVGRSAMWRCLMRCASPANGPVPTG